MLCISTVYDFVNPGHFWTGNRELINADSFLSKVARCTVTSLFNAPSNRKIYVNFTGSLTVHCVWSAFTSEYRLLSFTKKHLNHSTSPFLPYAGFNLTLSRVLLGFDPVS